MQAQSRRPLNFDFPLGRAGLFVDVTGAPAVDEVKLPYCDAFPATEAAARIHDGRFVHETGGDPFGGALSRGPGPGPAKATDVWPFKAFADRTLAWPALSPPVRVHWTKTAWWIVAVDPRAYAWRPRSCRLRNYSTGTTTRRNCLASKRIVGSGDSNMNALLRGIVSTTCESPPTKPVRNICPRRGDWTRRRLAGRRSARKPQRAVSSHAACPSALSSVWRGSAVCGQFLIGLHTQHFGDLPPPSPATPRDVLIANFGQWSAAKEHHTFARYRRAVDRWFATTWPAPAAGAMRVWASTVPTVRNDPWVRATQDWRTLSRLSLFNEYADAAAAAHGWIVLDSWNLTLPFLLAPREDVAHAAEAQRHHHVNVLLNLACGANGHVMPI